MSLIASWVAFPLLLAALGLGWGVLVERAAGMRVDNVLVIPLGLAAALVVAGTFTAFSATAPAATPIVASGAGIGLVLFWWPRPRVGRNLSLAFARREPPAPRAAGELSSAEGAQAAYGSPAAGALPAGEGPGAGRRGFDPAAWRLPGGWPALAALGAFLFYGAPVLLTGEATFNGYVKLDDTATWFTVVDVIMQHSHSLAALSTAFHPPSTFTSVFTLDVGERYPLGAFMLLGVGRELSGIDPAWIIQPYFACCAASLALGIFALARPLVASPRLRALIAFVAAQSALLYGYSLWGGIKEMTAAFVLVLGIALLVPLLRGAPRRLADARGLLPLAVAAGALLQTLEIGGGGWAGPALIVLAGAWLWGGRALRTALGSLAALVTMTAVCIVPVWASLSSFLGKHFAGLFSEGQTHAEKFGNLLQPISGWQLAGIWPAGDFRFTAPTLPTVPLIAVVVLAAVAGVVMAAGRRQHGPALYLGVGLFACGLEYALGTTPWVLGKSLALSSPALPAAALIGAAMLWSLRRGRAPGAMGADAPRIAGASPEAPPLPEAAPPAPVPARPAERPRGQAGQGSPGERLRARVWLLGPLAMLVIAGGVVYSNVLAYSDATIAPRPRMVELEHIGELVKGRGPTLFNQYEAYGDRHFLREGAPVEPAELRPYTVPLRNGAVLTKTAWANLDAFPLSTLLPYRSIVTMRAPVESRPPSIWHLVWQGRYYQLWQRPEPAPATIIEHIPYGEENEHPYCGNAESGATEPLCAMDPVAIPSCPQLLGFARRAAGEHAHLLAYERAKPVFTRGDEVLWPAAWLHESASHSLQPTRPGTAVGHIAVPSSQHYELYLGGSFGRGFEVRVDGRKVGAVANQLSGSPVSYIPVADIYLTAGVHTFEYTYPEAGLAPGSGEYLGMSEYWAAASRWTSLMGVELQPLDFPQSALLSVDPEHASTLCGRPLEWVEIVRGPAGAA
jgi:hypothetical protein